MSSYDNFRLHGAVLPSYHDSTILDGSTTANGLEFTELVLVVTLSGHLITPKKDFDKTKGIVVENPNSVDGLFLFQRKEDS